jgi:DNA gyrase inhibitor GyrI
MNELHIRIVKLEPMRAASTHGFGAGPEHKAWEKMRAFMQQKGYMNDLKAHRFFGFNNPDPSPGSPNYGYEQWITVTPDVEPEGDVRVKSYGGGLYAVAHCQLSHITETWKQLIVWREGSRYKPAHHQWLEECLTPFYEPEGDIAFDIYLPIAE